MTKRRTAPEIIAFHFCSDIRDVSDGRYQPTRYTSPGLYVVGADYYCSPSAGQKPPADYNWTKVGEYYGRDVLCAVTERDVFSPAKNRRV
jgi:hypothetical protein